MYDGIKELAILPANPYSGGDSALNDAKTTWWAKELADHLGIGNSTLRKWSLELEQAGYKFLRDEHNRRAYVEHDALALRQLKMYLDNGMTYSIATKTVTEDYMRSDSTEITPYAKPDFPQLPNNDRYDELTEKMDSLIEMNKELIKRLDERDSFIEQQFAELKELKAPAPLPPALEGIRGFTKEEAEIHEEGLNKLFQPKAEEKPKKVFDERPWWSRLIKK